MFISEHSPYKSLQNIQILYELIFKKKIDKIQKYTQNDAVTMVNRCYATNPICQTEVENETNKPCIPSPKIKLIEDWNCTRNNNSFIRINNSNAILTN